MTVWRSNVIVATILLAAFVLVLAVSVYGGRKIDRYQNDVGISNGVVYTTDIMEDDPGWDCHTMGNRICGSETGN